jgi:hypothetical protein
MPIITRTPERSITTYQFQKEEFFHPSPFYCICLIVTDQGRSEARFCIINEFLSQGLIVQQIWIGRGNVEDGNWHGRHIC